MIVVTGTEHAGVSLWLEILVSAGFPAVDTRFRDGATRASGPFPEQVTGHAVRMTIAGLARTDRAYVDAVVATVRKPAEYVALARQLREIEALSGGAKAPARSPWLDWWEDVYTLVRDVAARKYPAHLETHARLVAEPERVLREVLGWLGRGDANAAVARVRPVADRALAPSLDDADVDGAQRATFAALYAAIDSRAGLTPALVRELNATHVALLPRLSAGAPP